MCSFMDLVFIIFSYQSAEPFDTSRMVRRMRQLEMAILGQAFHQFSVDFLNS